jgi:hypothetical protein
LRNLILVDLDAEAVLLVERPEQRAVAGGQVEDGDARAEDALGQRREFRRRVELLQALLAGAVHLRRQHARRRGDGLVGQRASDEGATLLIAQRGFLSLEGLEPGTGRS